jgi:hypothetical protein
VAPLAPGHLEPGVGGGGFSDDSGAAVQYVVGRVGAGTERVVLDVEGIGPVGASLSNGSYIAWWAAGLSPANAPGRRHMQGKAFTVTAYDAAGQTTDRIGSAN